MCNKMSMNKKIYLALARPVLKDNFSMSEVLGSEFRNASNFISYLLLSFSQLTTKLEKLKQT